jgi:hypothetical protein
MTLFFSHLNKICTVSWNTKFSKYYYICKHIVGLLKKPLKIARKYQPGIQHAHGIYTPIAMKHITVQCRQIVNVNQNKKRNYTV